jgi:hypothetical protein
LAEKKKARRELEREYEELMMQYSEEERAHLRTVAGAWDERKRLEETSESLRQASVATKREIKRRLSKLLGSLQSTRNSGNAKRQFKRK